MSWFYTCSAVYRVSSFAFPVFLAILKVLPFSGTLGLNPIASGLLGRIHNSFTVLSPASVTRYRYPSPYCVVTSFPSSVNVTVLVSAFFHVRRLICGCLSHASVSVNGIFFDSPPSNQ